MMYREGGGSEPSQDCLLDVISKSAAGLDAAHLGAVYGRVRIAVKEVWGLGPEFNDRMNRMDDRYAGQSDHHMRNRERCGFIRN